MVDPWKRVSQKRTNRTTKENRARTKKKKNYNLIAEWAAFYRQVCASQGAKKGVAPFEGKMSELRQEIVQDEKVITAIVLQYRATWGHKEQIRGNLGVFDAPDIVQGLKWWNPFWSSQSGNDGS